MCTSKQCSVESISVVYFGYFCNVEIFCLSQLLSVKYNTALHTELISTVGNGGLMTLRLLETTTCSEKQFFFIKLGLNCG